ncbi:MAG: Crp/Fnr family transcriptional regulator [Pleurocapsa sp. SU_5_0]|nr:Crp/Fnr family transcriptional regulator [Pleurocapsa sp. SU_5_0]NJO96625.1 Crp/Fnr family transcriptional regulator [Pleurocapsa sp. CRU_1_2]NJR44878.1 Crp/Fnr family transcriptional regulator [Hyellaceae cyanobacterium CSU_1_1]
MIVKGCSSIADLQKILVFQDLATTQLESLIPFSYVREYQQHEIVMHEGDLLPQQLFALVSGRLEIKKTAVNGKETLVRLIPGGELFAAPAIFGNGIAPATIVCQIESCILTIERSALLEVISRSPEISLRILEVFNKRLQQLHNTVHGLISEQATVRLVRLIQYYGDTYGYTSQIHDGTHPVAGKDCLNVKLPYYQIARSIGITYEECVRLFKKLKGIITYKRGGTIIILDRSQLEAFSDPQNTK